MTESRAGHDLDLEHVLAFERAWENRTSNREAAIRAAFGCSPARYYQALIQHLDDPAALAADPMLVNRLRRLREARRAKRDVPHVRRIV
jgi:hypothetical protein